MSRGKWLLCAALVMILAQSGCSEDSTAPAADDDPICGLSTTSLYFGDVIVGDSQDLAFDIENTGEGVLSGTVSLSCEGYQIVGDPSYSLSAAGVGQFTVRFTPASLGVATCEVETGSDLCETIQCTGTGIAHYYVDASSGLDTNPGTIAQPFRTVTHAVSAAGTYQTIQVLPGTYDAALGETFPIILKEGQSLIGDIAGKGRGASATVVYGAGDASPEPGDAYLATIVGADQAMVAGLNIDAPYEIRTFGIYLSSVTMTITDNTFSSTPNLYGGIRSKGTSATTIARNDFLTSSYGVYNFECSGGMTIEENDFQTMAIPVDIVGNDDDTTIRGNTFSGTGQNGIQVQRGMPLIEENVFDKPGGYVNYGAIRCQQATANPTVRGNTFICARAIRIDLAVSVDMGTAADPGGNYFDLVSGESVYHMGDAALSAIGNTWPHASPICGTDIVLTGSGTVTWGAGAGEACP